MKEGRERHGDTGKRQGKERWEREGEVKEGKERHGDT